MTPTRTTFTSIAVALVAIAVMAAGCSSDPDITVPTTAADLATSSPPTTAASSSTTVGSTSTTSTPAAALAPPATYPANSNEEAIVRDAEALWRAAAEWVGLPDSADRERYTTGAVFRQWREDALNSQSRNRISREPDSPAHYVSVTNIVFESPTRAFYDVCVVKDNVVFHRETGEILNDDVSTKLYNSTVDLVDGTWKLAGIDLAEGNDWDGIAGCALA